MLRELLDTNNAEERFKKQEKKFKELLMRSRELDKQSDELFEGIDVSHEELTNYLSNPDNFTAEDWEKVKTQLDEQKQDVTDLLEKQRDIAQVRKAYEQRAEVQRHWMFVR